ncbi:uncharacterized protein [Ptychodera flava]|uniref:uncharacterized protein n=1 Tax=Ptychodera flava TaxID=63121 RepID=UPI00396A14B4
MPPKKRQVWAYGRHKKRMIKNDPDDWLSPTTKAVDPTPVFSSPDSEHSHNSDETNTDNPIGRLLCETMQRQSPLLDEILATPEVVAKKKARTLAEDTPDLDVVVKLHKENDHFMITARRRACSPVSSLCFSDNSNFSMHVSNAKPVPKMLTRISARDKENLPADDRKTKTRQYTKLSRKCKKNSRTEVRLPRQEERIALDLSEIEKCELEVAKTSPSDFGRLRSESASATDRTLETPPLLTVHANRDFKDSAYDSNEASTPVCTGSDPGLEHGQTSTPFPRNAAFNPGKESGGKDSGNVSLLSGEPVGMDVERSSNSTPNCQIVKPCSVSLERLSANNLSGLSVHSHDKSTQQIREKSSRSSAGSCQNCVVKLEPLTPSTLERLMKRTQSASDEELEEIVQDISMLSINSCSDEDEEGMDVSSCHSDGDGTGGDMSESAEKQNRDKFMIEFLDSGSETSFYGFPSVTTPAKSAVKSFLKAESFKEALTPVKKEKVRQVPPREKVLMQCGQTQPISFSKCIPKGVLNRCSKIGEGTFGEVFRTQNHGLSVALKIIPIEGDFPVNDEPQKSFEDILPEIVISKELSALDSCDKNMACNFIHVNDVSLVKGHYPKHLLTEWDKFDRERESENDRPDMFNSNQLFIILEFADGGSDLEHFQFDNILQAKSVLHQVTCALAVAERALHFEHRDLHWGNILVRHTDVESLFYKLNGEMLEVPTNGVEVNIIDFTMSRLQKDGCTVFCNLATDETLFEGEGDYQFEVYRLMKKYNSNNWEKSCPITNVLWLRYLTDKLLKGKKYKSTKQLASTRKQFREFFKDGLSYSSAEEVLLKSNLF